MHSLKLTLPLKIGLLPQKEAIIFQPSIFRGELLVSGRVFTFKILGGGNSNLFYLHPYVPGEMIQFNEHIFQIGLKHQLV